MAGADIESEVDEEQYKIMMEQADPDAKALLDLMNETGYNVVQENGQRRYGGPPPDWNDRPPPPKGSEIFAGRIPRDCFEPELVPVFSRIGKIYELRLMMDFSGSNRGYAFVTYTNTTDAIRAIIELNNYEIRKNKFLGVVKSVDNCRLFVGGIPRTKTKDEILNEMKRLTEGVVDVILYRAVADKSKSRGFAFVEYDSHKSAAMARRKLLPGKIPLWGNEIAVDWAEPEPEVDPVTMSRVRALYFRNLMLDTTEDTLRDLCGQIRKNSVVKVKKMRDYAFVHFISREDAEAVLEELNNTEIDGSVVELSWAKPVDRLMRNGQDSRRRFGAYRRGAGFGARGGALGAGGGGDFSECTPYLLSPPNHTGQSYAPHWQAVPVDHSSVPQLVPFPPVVNERFGAPTMYSRGRGRGAGGLRNNYMTTDYRNRDQNHFPTELGQYSGIPTQVLHNLCQKNNLGEPSYQLLTGPMWRDQVTNRWVQLYSFRVTVPEIPGYYFQPSKFSANVEDARNFAAENILNIVFRSGHADAADLRSPSLPATAPPTDCGSRQISSPNGPSSPDQGSQQNTKLAKSTSPLPPFPDRHKGPQSSISPPESYYSGSPGPIADRAQAQPNYNEMFLVPYNNPQQLSPKDECRGPGQGPLQKRCGDRSPSASWAAEPCDTPGLGPSQDAAVLALCPPANPVIPAAFNHGYYAGSAYGILPYHACANYNQ